VLLDGYCNGSDFPECSLYNWATNSFPVSRFDDSGCAEANRATSAKIATSIINRFIDPLRPGENEISDRLRTRFFISQHSTLDHRVRFQNGSGLLYRLVRPTALCRIIDPERRAQSIMRLSVFKRLYASL